MTFKRITILCGHYGSGKTNIAVNLAFFAKNCYDRVAVADIDIVNPYYRTKDSGKELAAAGIRLIVSQYANSNLDVPALPQDLVSVTADKNQRVIMDVGGDDRGALALGRLARAIEAENDYEMLFVVNRFRPLMATPEGALEIMREIEKAASLKFTAIVNNPNIGGETAAKDVIESADYIKKLELLTGLKCVLTTAREDLECELRGKVDDLFPLKLQKKII